MKKQTFTATRRILVAVAFAAALAVPILISRAQSGGGILDVLEQAKQSQAQQLEGAWAWTITPVVPPGVPPPPPSRAYGTFARGGAVTVYVRSAPNGPQFSPQHGVWEHLGGNEFAITQIRDEFDAQGNFQGTAKINTRLTLVGKDEFVSVGSREFRDANGNIADIIRCSTIKAERIKIDPLATQCQSITPPQ